MNVNLLLRFVAAVAATDAILTIGSGIKERARRRKVRRQLHNDVLDLALYENLGVSVRMINTIFEQNSRRQLRDVEFLNRHYDGAGIALMPQIYNAVGATAEVVARGLVEHEVAVRAIYAGCIGLTVELRREQKELLQARLEELVEEMELEGEFGTDVPVGATPFTAPVDRPVSEAEDAGEPVTPSGAPLKDAPDEEL